MRHYDYSQMKSVELNPKTLGWYDAVVIATDHSSYDYPAIVDAAQLVVDTRSSLFPAPAALGTRRITRHRNKTVLC